MKTRKSWFKKALAAAIIIAVIGGGVYAASELYDGHNEEETGYTLQTSLQSGFHDKEYSPFKEDDHEQSEGRGDGHHEEEWDGAGLAAGIGGGLLGTGLLYSFIRRKKRQDWSTGGQTAFAAPSTSKFLDQWETHQMNLKETK
ncbi:hypothetical protein [Paenibacillus camerounensis]|uniref:hypothetical protein n=1 Tax=Paenibacillus camerounensis TaxID=1243663 RepID=UPI0005A9227C|nr:hypothetical protein [Paenibacillus camerounensis]